MAEGGNEMQIACDFCKEQRRQVGELTCGHRMCANCFPFYSNKLDKCYICVLAAAEVKREAMKIIKGSADEQKVPLEEEKLFCPNSDCSFVGSLPTLFSHKIACNLNRAAGVAGEEMSDVLAFFGKRHGPKTSVFLEIMKDSVQSKIDAGQDSFSAREVHLLTLAAWLQADRTFRNEGVEPERQEIEQDEEVGPNGHPTEIFDRDGQATGTPDSDYVVVSEEADDPNLLVGTSEFVDLKLSRAETYENGNSEGTPVESDSSSVASDELVDKAVLKSATCSHEDPDNTDSDSDDSEENEEEPVNRTVRSTERSTGSFPGRQFPGAFWRENPESCVPATIMTLAMLVIISIMVWQTEFLNECLRLREAKRNEWKRHLLSGDLTVQMDHVSEIIAESQFNNQALRFHEAVEMRNYEVHLGLGATRQNGTNVLWVTAVVVKEDEQPWPGEEIVELRMHNKDMRLAKNCTFELDDRGLLERWHMDYRGEEKLRHLEQQATKHLRMMRFTEFLAYDDAVEEGFIEEDSMKLGIKLSLPTRVWWDAHKKVRLQR